SQGVRRRHRPRPSLHALPAGPGGGAVSAPVAAIAGVAAGVVALGAMTLTVRSTVHGAEERLKAPAPTSQTVLAANSEEAYCRPRFKEVLERVLHSCGLAEGEARRGCQPADVKTFASISGQDFNELFTPLRERGAVILFDVGKEDLDAGAQKMLEDKWLDSKDAHYFLL